MYAVLWGIDHRDRTGGISDASLRNPGGGRGACGQSVYLGGTPQKTDVSGTDTGEISDLCIYCAGNVPAVSCHRHA